jgi:hypothetical protein
MVVLQTLIECKICGKNVNFLPSHLMMHNMTAKEYRLKYPNEPISSVEFREKLSKAQKGLNKGLTYEELYGVEKAKYLKELRAKCVSKARKGKTYEEIFGPEKAKYLRQLRHEQFTRPRPWQRTKSYRQKVALRMKLKGPSYPKYRFVEELGHSVRSSWEKTVCLVLKQNNINYAYEKYRFDYKNGVDDIIHTYTPDIVVECSDKLICIEPHSVLIKESINKWKGFKEFHPQHLLYLLVPENQIKNIPQDCADMIFPFNLQSINEIAQKIKQLRNLRDIS